MEVLPCVALVIFTGLASLLILQRLIPVLKHTRGRVRPPGPKPWPIIGNLHMIGPSHHRCLDELSKQYGEIMLLQYGNRHVLVASSPTIAKEILKTHDEIFSSRPANIVAGKYASYNCSDMTWAPYGQYWRQARKIYFNELFSPKQLNRLEYIRVEERKAFISRISGLLGQEVVIRDHLTRFTLSSMCRMALGENYFDESGSGSSKGNLKDVQDMLDEWFVLNGIVNIGDWIPWLGFLDLQGHVKKMKILSKRFDRFFRIVVGDHKDRMMKKEEKEGFLAKDIVDVLLQLCEDPNLETKLTSESVKGLILDLLAGGTDTSALTIEWAISELLKQPRIMKKAVEEIDGVIGRERWVEEKDIFQLPYINAIVKETLRLRPVGSVLAPHLSTKDCTISGYHIPEGTIALINVWSIGRDPKYWPEPERFLPERFLGTEIDERGQHFQFLPFGSGRRMCPGYSLGLKLIQSTLANLLHGFELKLPENMKPGDVSMEDEYGLATRRAIPIVAVLKPRLPPHMYGYI